ncbi:MAG: formate dehydrogenase accessory sulfurtransferase FdhD [Bacteroidia bacterium]
MSKPSVAAIHIQKVTSNDNAKFESNDADDLCAVEEPLEIRIGCGKENDRFQKNISVTMRTPGNDFELATGFLFTEGILKNIKDVLSIKYCTDADTIENKENIVRVELQPDVDFDLKSVERNFYTSSSCGVCGKASIDAVRTIIETDVKTDSIKIPSSLIIQLPELLRKQQNVFEYTGGLHACALFDLSGNLLLIREDVGRHNALDKLAGAALATNILPLNKHILLLSGRASFELIQKAAMAGIKIVCAIGAPSSLAVQMASEFGITLIGFLHHERFNIYSNSQRILI